MRNRIHATSLVLAAMVSPAGVAHAVTPSDGRPAEERPGVAENARRPHAAAEPDQRAPSVGSRPSTFLGGSKALGAATLAASRGGTALASDMQLQGVVAENRVSDASTGSNLITQGAFNGAVGVPVVIQNSGNNVLIQNATIINLQLK